MLTGFLSPLGTLVLELTRHLDLLIGVFLIVRVTRRMGLTCLWPERKVKQKKWIQKL